MNPSKLISKVRKIFPTLKQDQKKPIIDLVNGFEEMLKEKYYTDVIELLVYSRMKDHFMRAEVYEGKPIPMNQFWEWLKRDLDIGVEQIKNELKDILKDHELANKLKDRKNFNNDFAPWDKMLSKTMSEIKMKMYWDKKQTT